MSTDRRNGPAQLRAAAPPNPAPAQAPPAPVEDSSDINDMPNDTQDNGGDISSRLRGFFRSRGFLGGDEDSEGNSAAAEYEDLDTQWEREELEFEKEIQRNFRQGIKLPARDIPKRKELVASYREWIAQENARWDKIHDEREKRSLSYRFRKYWLQKGQQVLSCASAMANTFPTSASEAQERFSSVIEDLLAPPANPSTPLESSLMARWQKTAASLEAYAAYWDERRFFLRGAFNLNSPNAIDMTRGMDLHNKVAVVTGATGGIGREVTKALAITGATVIGTSRSNAGCVEFIRDMQEEYGLHNVSCIKTDLADPFDITKFVSKLESRELPVHIMVHAAGVINDYPPISADGFDKSYAVNHLGQAMVTELLYPAFRRAAQKGDEPRIVSVSCGAHRFATLTPEQINIRSIRSFSGVSAYSVSKLAQLAYIQSLAERYRTYGIPITANSVNPGAFIDTKLTQRTFFPRLATRLAKRFQISKTTEQAAAEVVHLATHPSFKRVTGKYFENWHEAKPSALAQDPTFVAHMADETTSQVAMAMSTSSLEMTNAMYKFVLAYKDRLASHPIKAQPVSPEHAADWLRMQEEKNEAIFQKRIRRSPSITTDQAGALFDIDPVVKPLTHQILTSRETKSVNAWRSVNVGLKELQQRQRQQEEAARQQPPTESK